MVKGSPWKPDAYSSTRRLTPEEIITIVAAYHQRTPESLKTKSRLIEAVHPRQIAIYFLRELTPLSVVTIGRVFNRDHTTILWSIQVVKNRIETETVYAQNIHFIRHLLDKATWKL